MQRALKTIDLNAEVVLDKTSENYKLFKSFITENNLYDSNKLELCGILLGAGSFRDKFLALFEHFDQSAKGKLQIEETRDMLHQMIEMSLELIPASTDNENMSRTLEINEYLRPLIEVKPKFIEKTLNCLFGTKIEISFDEIIKKIEEFPKLERLV